MSETGWSQAMQSVSKLSKCPLSSVKFTCLPMTLIYVAMMGDFDQERYLDLQAYELIELTYYEPQPDPQGWTQLFRLEVRSRSVDRVEAVKRRSEHLLAQARKKIGRGPRAAVLSSERLLMEFPLANLSKWQRVKNCSGHTWVSPDDLYGLSFNSSNLDLLRASLRKLNKTCGELD